MIELMVAFEALKAAHSAIKEGVELYKNFKEDGKDLSEIVSDIGGHLGGFFTKQEEYIEAAKQEKAKPLVKKSINQEAMDRILRQEQIQQMETELREMIIYQMGMPGLWSKFTEMREIVRKEREKIEREQKKPVKKPNLKNGSLSTSGRLGLHCQQVYSYCLQPLLFLCTESI
jgi:hypothetical protein